MPRESRLQVRVDADLKDWFREYAEERGGMSQVVTKYIKRLKTKQVVKEEGIGEPSTASK